VLRTFNLPMSSTHTKKKLTLFHYTPPRRFGGEDVQLLLILDLGTTWEWVDSVTTRPRFTLGERTPPVPIVQEAGWAPELVWTQRLEKKVIFPLPKIESWLPGRPVRSQTLHWLSYPGSPPYWPYLYIFYLCLKLVFSFWGKKSFCIFEKGVAYWR
jgi:hypothetical protein